VAEEQQVLADLRSMRSELLAGLKDCGGIDAADPFLDDQGTEYALCRLPLARVLQTVDAGPRLSPATKERWHREAVKVFDSFERP
jgi:hypothetical protein